MRKKTIFALLCCLIAFSVYGPAWSQPKEEFKQKPIEKSASYYLPSISEVYNSAQSFRITTNWAAKIKIKSVDYAKMPEVDRAFTVGKDLSDIAFLVLSKEEKEKPSANMLEKADLAIVSLNPSAEIKKRLQNLKDGVRTGTLKGEQLRKELDKVLNEVIPAIEKDPKLRDAGTLVWAAGFLRALYLGASTVAGFAEPTEEQLSMFRYGGTIGYFVEYFSEKAGDAFKTSAVVKNLLITLKKIQPILEKAPGKVTKQDLTDVAKELEAEFK
ncbi:MAG: hypothetical protein HQK60_07075 [Deltaproteobacteria bacterium]|nr:hypothetical protein [Deltaproteobacteria bacterium]